jgi:putative ABC transport system permease protein
MNWKTDIQRTLDALALPPSRQAEIAEELSQHLQDRYDELRAAGATGDDARREALSELDDGDLVRELTGVERAARPGGLELGEGGRSALAHVPGDVRYAVRALRKQPGFSAVVILTLAIGIGATAAIFSVVQTVMLAPLPFGGADRLVRIWESDVVRGRPFFSVSQPNFVDFRAQNHTFAALAALTGAGFNLWTPDGAELLQGNRVSRDFFAVLGATPAIGRTFVEEEDRPGGNTRVAIVTHGFWQHRLGGAADVLNRTVTLDDARFAIVGVLPPSFRWGSAADALFVPLAADPAQSRGDHRLLMIGRLKPEVTIDQAVADLKAIAARLSTQYPESNGGWSVFVRSFYDWLVPAETRQMLLIVVVAVGVVLLIAATNVANLMLARAASRQKEISIRLALGAGRGRVAAQLLVESLVLALLGGAFGCAVAYGATSALKGFGPASLPRIDELAIDGRVLLFTLVVTLATGVLFGCAPAAQAFRTGMNDALKDGGRSGAGGAGRQRLRTTLVVAEVALSVALLVGAGLLVRSLWMLQNVNPGFDTRSLMTVQVSANELQYPTSADLSAFYRRVLDSIRALPGVRAAAATSIVPMSGGNTSIEVFVEGFTTDTTGLLPSADWRIVSAGYFQTLGVGLRGRDFTDRDARDAPLVAIVSDDMARRYWPGVDPIGRIFRWHSATGPRFTVVGVAGEVRNLALDTDPAPVIYLPNTMMSWNPMFLTVRTATDPSALVTPIRHALREIDPKVPMSSVRTADDVIGESLGSRQFSMALLTVFAAVALTLASVGLYGVLAYLVSQRTHDIGVRLALGAMRRDIFRLVIGRGMLLAGAGSVLGLAAAYWLSRSLESLLFQVKPTDAATFAGVAGLLLLVAAAACYVPARRATRVDPLIALRYE